jgi:predicted membrane channel-forming protein YqfA (hemolysin III family)
MSMENQGDKIAPRLRISGGLISLGLLIEAFTLSWNNPVAFLVFLGIGGLFLAVGIVFYLLSLVSPSRS